MGQTKEIIQNIGLKVRVSLIKAMVVTTVTQVILQRNVQHTEKHVIHATKRGILSHIAGPDKEAKAKKSRCPTQHKDSPDKTNMKLWQTIDQNDNSNWFKYEQDSVQVLFS